MRIPGSIALVTGSAKRVGRALVLELAARGANVAIHYRESEREARLTLAEARDAGAEAELFSADLTRPDERDALVEGVRTRFGGLDVLVNNASAFGPAALDRTTPEAWDEQVDTNAKAPFFLARTAGRSMVAAGRGKIINIADTAAESIWPRYLPYSISKAALLGVTRGLAKSLAPQVQVNAVAPGPVLFPEYYTEDQKRTAIERTLLKRPGSPEDVARAVVFLIENDYVTGETLHVDGGRHLL